MNRNSIWRNPFVLFFWYILVFFMAIFALVGVILFYFFFGAGYELNKCYENRKQGDEEDSDRSIVVHKEPEPVRNVASLDEQENERSECLITFGLYALGVLLQPFYILFQGLKFMIECYRKFGCWLYYYSN